MAVGGEGGNKAVVAAFVGNFTIAVAKMVAALVTGSSSMLSESIHSFADAGNQALLLFGARQAKKVADDEHQFGYGRERYFWSFVVALVLFALGSAFALYHGYHQVVDPHPVTNIRWAVGVLVFGLIVEGFTLRTAVVESRKVKGDLTWWQFIRRARVPELPVVLLEDLGAQLGLATALICLLISEFFDAPIWDGIGSLAIGVLLGIIAVILIIEMRSLLIGEGARPGEMVKIRAAIDGAPGVKQLIHIRTQHIGPDELLIGAKIMFDPDLSVSGLAESVNEVEKAIRAEVAYARPIYIEPDLLRAPEDLTDTVDLESSS